MKKWTDVLLPTTLYLGQQLANRAIEERNKGVVIYPPQDKLFRALELTPPEKVKVCIIGQDPYHSPGAANGLAFSVPAGAPPQPSLTNIFKELESDLGLRRPPNGDLTPWAERGVLLLNTSLTVYEHQANSCQNWGWDRFIRDILHYLHSSNQPIVYLLWGGNAHTFMTELISSPAVYPENNKHVVMERMLNKVYILSSHPSPFSAYKGCKGTPSFFGSKPFSTTNKFLEEMGAEPIDWEII